MREQLIIGVVGETGSGKDDFLDILEQHLKDGTTTRIARARFSDVLRKRLVDRGIPEQEHTTQLLQKEAQDMEEDGGKGALAEAMRKHITYLDADVVLICGVRWLTDETLIRDFPNNLMVYVTALSWVRYLRKIGRKEKAEEATMTRDEFDEIEQAPNEIHIADIGSRADFIVENSINDEERRFLRKNVIKFSETLVSKAMSSLCQKTNI